MHHQLCCITVYIDNKGYSFIRCLINYTSVFKVIKKERKKKELTTFMTKPVSASTGLSTSWEALTQQETATTVNVSYNAVMDNIKSGQLNSPTMNEMSLLSTKQCDSYSTRLHACTYFCKECVFTKINQSKSSLTNDFSQPPSFLLCVAQNEALWERFG